uniref:Uncharacterized protein n=1 Tax=Mola mola TaxID=94237 RepID=A0A3Q3W3E6_MOLML
SIYPTQVINPIYAYLRQETIICNIKFLVSCQVEVLHCCLMEAYRSLRPLCQTLEHTYAWLKTLQALRWARPNSEYKVQHTLKSSSCNPFSVHGGFSEWAEWGVCSVSCGIGSQKRLRQCNNPLPANGGRHCVGSDKETRSCQGKPCPVDGNWSEWSLWEECSRNCGQGNRTRIRTCSDPPAQHGGRTCEGKAVEVIMCSLRPCPVAGNWGSWLPWSPCSETCGKGMQSRLRLCNNPPPAFDGRRCEGSDTQTHMCKERPCPVDGKWSSWVSWGACSVSCGGGTRQRTRLCASPAPQYGGRQCEGNDVHIDFCNSNPCPIDGNWGLWQLWGECSASCGNGERTRVRLCNSPSPNNGGRPCPGDSSQLSRCNTQACPGKTFWYCICVQLSAGFNTLFNTLCFCQVGPKRREEAS